MNAIQTLLTDHLDLWTSALLAKSTAGRGSNGKLEAYGIKRLRALILELAVRGKLLPQDPNDEPAIVLLEKIAKEKTRLIKEGQLKKENLLPDIGDDEKSFELPPGWEWVRFGTIAQHNSGKTLDSGRNTGQLRDYITTSNLYWGRFDLVNIRQMPITDDELGKCTARKGDLLICEGGESGRAAVWPYDHEVCFQNHVHRARFYGEEIDPYFVYRFFEKLNATGEIDQHRKGVGISNMSSKALALIALPLPPFAEQHRIVAKVDELMALCDQLEQQQTHSIEAHQALVEALLGTLTRVESQQEFSAAWARIANHFDTLFTTEASIAQLKQTILQLAVMGKLVPQDPSDEPAKELIDRISEFREQSFAGKRAKAPKTIRELFESESDHDIPDNWAWCRLGDLVLDFRYGTSRKCSRESSGVPVLRIPNIQNGRIDPTDLKFTDMAASEYEELRLREGDLLLVRSNGSESLVGRSAVASADDERFAYAGYLVRARIPREIVFSPYLHVTLSTPSVRSQIEDPIRTTSGVKNINTTELSNLVLSLPPLAEQHRIVAKVDELMALCDALKARISDAKTTQLHLADAIVEQAVC